MYRFTTANEVFQVYHIEFDMGQKVHFIDDLIEGGVPSNFGFLSSIILCFANFVKHSLLCQRQDSVGCGLFFSYYLARTHGGDERS